MDPHRLGLAFGTQFPAAVLEVADQFLLLRVDRDGRLAGSLKAAHLGIDMFELGIALRMAGPFARLAVGLKTEAKTPQQPTNQFVAGHKATLDQRAGEMPLTLADASRATAGSPQMADWTSSASASSSPDCRSIAALRPPPARRTRPPR